MGETSDKTISCLQLIPSITVFAPLNEDAIGDLAFGAIKLDAEGTVLSYNTAESGALWRESSQAP